MNPKYSGTICGKATSLSWVVSSVNTGLNVGDKRQKISFERN